MRTGVIRIIVSALVVTAALAGAAGAQGPYPAMAPLQQYLIADEGAEVALARSAAPASISDDAEVMVLGRDGYRTAVKGKNGFVCMVERSWANASDAPDFWNPKLRAPQCFNPQAARSFLPIYLMKTKLVLAGRSKAVVVAVVASAFDKKQLPALEPNAMVYMMSKEQYLGDRDKGWHPHLMFLVAGDAVTSWGANLPGSPVLAADDPEERATIFLVPVNKWSDGTEGPPLGH